MTTEQCRHYTVDGSAYCNRCKDEWYLDTPFTLNDVDYVVWQYHGVDLVTSEDYWSCRRVDGGGSIAITSADIDNAINNAPPWAPLTAWHDEY